MSVELARAIAAALDDVRLTSTNASKLRKKLAAAAIDPLLPSLSLEQVRALGRRGNGAALDDVIRDMTLTQLKKVSKAWNPHRKIAADMIMRDLQVEVRELAAGRRSPEPGPPPGARTTRARRGVSAARIVAAE